MNKNNFAELKVEGKVELRVFYDNELGSMYYRENFERLSHEDFLFYTGGADTEYFGENLRDYINLDNLTNEQLLEDVQLINGDVDELDNVWEGDAKEYLLFLLKEYNQVDWDELGILRGHGTNGTNLPKNCARNLWAKYGYIVSCGHCQGDSKVVIYPKALAEIWGIELENLESMIQNSVDHLLWDTPIYARAEIDGVEIYLDEFLESSYEWNVEKVKAGLEKMENIPENAKNWLIANLPKNPDHV